MTGYKVTVIDVDRNDSRLDVVLKQTTHQDIWYAYAHFIEEIMESLGELDVVQARTVEKYNGYLRDFHKRRAQVMRDVDAGVPVVWTIDVWTHRFEKIE